MQTPNEIIHQPIRLKIMAALNTLAAGQWLEFVSLKSIVDTTDGNLGAHLNTLEGAQYVLIKKDFAGKKPRTRVCLSAKGREAFAGYVAALHAILALETLEPDVSGSHATNTPPDNNR
ncbi:winged helix-turn-helix domain-containing protein [Halopseudomonas sp.]|jgi:DNA-binding MarR family transcriptional regulator|uniref:winged helix-turn-helix domain-containing protein n=1 Tax=Halopseudomonas sp. TaxID=2901191 RepID=UPI001A38A4C8|nr:transcriptional regulator [Pseudomonas sp.]|tara:strand:+ start:2827 stop:3180 length:354 start_codon:yes stop_codon:yes gene_type:complete